MIFRFKRWRIEIDESLLNEDIEKIKEDLRRYFSGERVEFDYNINLGNFTPFQQAVLREIKRVPYGSTVSYGGIATRLGIPDAYRAVGNVCRSNPLPIIIPCHRVVGRGSLGDYRFGKELKRYLILMESGKE